VTGNISLAIEHREDEMADQVVLYTKEEQVGIVTINRPEVKNSLNIGVFRALEEVLNGIAADDDIRVVIVTGAGNAFVSGADINELLALSIQDGWQSSRYQQSVFNKLERLRKPSIAAINGFAMGGGLELALSCTFRIASTKARLGFPELGLGIIPAFGGTQRLTRTVGYAKAAELILLRSIIGTDDALRIGLVNEVVEPDKLMDKAKEWALNLAQLSPVAVSLELELLLNAANGGFDSGLALESGLASLAVASPEAKNLLGLFLNKGKK
jgi:enoyl-CoA hydratase